MESIFPSDLDLKNLVKELSEGRDLAKQLQIHLNVQSSPHENCEFLLHRILYSYDQALAMLSHGRPTPETAVPPAVVVPAVVVSDSPGSLVGSPHSDDSDQDKDQASRKRKAVVIRWTEKVKISPESGIEGQLDDGYGWRKYGQKDILGATYPRGYYRCTNRHGQGCLATKQVQRSDDDPTVVEVTYRRKHTCNARAHFNNNNNNNPPVSEDPNPSPETQQPINIQTSLRVITNDLGTNKSTPPFDPFNFPSPSTNFLGDYNSPTLISPATTGSNYYPISTDLINNYEAGLMPDLHTLGSELSPIVAAMSTTSATNSPTIGTSFSTFGNISDFGSSFGFGNPGYFP